MKNAKDRIIFPLDFPTAEDAKGYVDLLAGEVGMFKVGLELFISSGPEFIKYIIGAGDSGVFLDLKLHDIPVTVMRAVKSISKLGVTFATVHCSESAMLEAAVLGSEGRVGILGVTVLTSVSGENLRESGFKEKYASDLSSMAVRRASMARDAGCAGVICSGLESGVIKKTFGENFLTVTPGIRPAWSLTKNDDQHRITTPRYAVENGSDYLVIGRPIRDSKDPVRAVRMVAEEISI